MDQNQKQFCVIFQENKAYTIFNDSASVLAEPPQGDALRKHDSISAKFVPLFILLHDAHVKQRGTRPLAPLTFKAPLM